MAVVRRDLQAGAQQADRTVGAALRPAHLRGKRQEQPLRGRTRPAHVLAPEVALQRARPEFAVDLPVVFQLHPRLGCRVELGQG